jgi:hypothetical protein
MTQRELHRAVALATGESLAEIARRGFQPWLPESESLDPEDRIVDWEALELQRNVAVIDHPPYPRAVA